MAGAATNPGQDGRSAGRIQGTATTHIDLDAAIDARVEQLVTQHEQTAPLTDEQIHRLARIYASAATRQHADTDAA